MNPSPVQSLRVILFGGSGMVGSAVLDECLKDERVEAVLAAGRSSCGREHPKLKEVLLKDPSDLGPVAGQFGGYNACFFTLGVSSVGMSEADYTRISYELTLRVAKTLLELNPGLAFTYVSGVGTDSTETGKTMWARVKGRTENALLAMPFRAAVMFRLGGLVPLRGTKFKSMSYKIMFGILGPIFPVLAKLFPGMVSTPRNLGRAMIAAGLGQSPQRHLNPRDINALGR